MPGDQSLLKGLNKIIEDKIYAQALEITLHSISIGRDAKYAGDRLVTLGITALIRQLNLKPLYDLLSPSADTEAKEFIDIINLAKIYEESHL